MGVARILIAEDDGQVRELVRRQLEHDGIQTVEAPDGLSALRLARRSVDGVVLDVGLPVLDGLEILRTLRREGCTVPIALLSGRDEEYDRIIGLEAGADDYIIKPFSPRELAARVRALLRRSGRPIDAPLKVLHFDRLEIDERAREVRVDGSVVAFKPREFALLLVLASNAGIALSRATILERVWGFDFDGDVRTVDVHVRRIRAKLAPLASRARPIVVTLNGFGYKFAA
jgi:DNA-binding response OmpR family regulator